MDAQCPAKRILIVDDNRDAAEVIAQILQLHGFATATASDGSASLQVAKDFSPDIILLDLGMPVMDGYTAAVALRKLPELGHVVLIAFSAWGDPQTRAKTAACGFDRHIVKPATLATILDAIS